jgi:hypothetical protein
LVDLLKREGFAAAQGEGMLVVLDTALTPELMREGLARDFVRGIQDARKSAGFRIEDRIAIEVGGDPEAIEAIEAFRRIVMGETLATTLTTTATSGMSDAVEPEDIAGPGGASLNGTFRDQIAVGRHQVRVAIHPHGTAHLVTETEPIAEREESEPESRDARAMIGQR